MLQTQALLFCGQHTWWLMKGFTSLLETLSCLDFSKYPWLCLRTDYQCYRGYYLGECSHTASEIHKIKGKRSSSRPTNPKTYLKSILYIVRFLGSNFPPYNNISWISACDYHTTDSAFYIQNGRHRSGSDAMWAPSLLGLVASLLWGGRKQTEFSGEQKPSHCSPNER